MADLDYEAICRGARDLKHLCDLYDAQHPYWWLTPPAWHARLGLKPGERLLIGPDRLILVQPANDHP